MKPTKLIIFYSFFLVVLLMDIVPAEASISYDIAISRGGYNMLIEMNFKKGITLQQARSALKNSELLSRLSPNVVSVKNTPVIPVDGEKYKSLMTVKSFGIYSRLLSQCLDKNTPQSWQRSCSLQTRELDGGKYMAWKGDDVECTEKENVICKFNIRGQAKPLKVLGLQIVSAELFSVKAKLQALANFFKLYTFIQGHSLSSRASLEKFNHSALKTELEFFEKEGTKAVKTTGTYVHKFSLKESE